MPRRLRPEVMDDPSLDPAEHAAALRGLDRLNRMSRSIGPLWRAVRETCVAAKRSGASSGGFNHRKPPQRNTTELPQVRILDLACGSGRGVIALQRLADRHRPLLHIRFDGCDVSDTAIRHARTAAVATGLDKECVFESLDVLQDSLPNHYNAMLCSLFLHHLTREEAVGLLRAMSEASGHIVVNDLVRSRLNLGAVWLAARVVTRSRVVHVDGPASVWNAWTPGELRAMAEEAGLEGARVRRVFPCRMMLTWSRGRQ